MKKLVNNKNGITLIALVITIIVLLILAGVTINLTMGENGIFKTAQQAAKNYTNAQDKELADLEEFTNTADKIIQNVTGGRAYSLGDEVTIKGEAFYVMKDSPANESTVTLLAKDNIDVATLKQSAGAGTIAFSSTNYWSNETSYLLDLNNYTIPDGVTSIITTVKAYGKSLGATGRLMTKEEANILKTANSDLLYGRNGKSSSESLDYWLGSVPSAELVCISSGYSSILSNNFYYKDSNYGVRPVIEISKSLL